MSKSVEVFGGTSINGKRNIGRVLTVKLESKDVWRINASVLGYSEANGIF